MNREDLIQQIIEVTFNYHMRYAMDMVPDDMYKWIKSLLRRLDNKELAKEAKNCGIKIEVKDIFISDKTSKKKQK